MCIARHAHTEKQALAQFGKPRIHNTEKNESSCLADWLTVFHPKLFQINSFAIPSKSEEFSVRREKASEWASVGRNKVNHTQKQ